MPRPRQEFDPNTLPDPEINPLLNPLLAANMGRWAEVYFTTPPEKRGQAIYDLIRELEKNSHEPSLVPEAIENENSLSTIDMEEPRASLSGTILACPACGHENPAGQKFCGMCGATMPVLPAAPVPAEVTQKPMVKPIPIRQTSSPSGDFDHRDSDSSGAPAFREDRNSFVPHQEYSENDLPSFAVQSEPVPYRYRLYVGIVMAILIGVLLYMAWRGTDALSGARHPALSEAVPEEPVPAKSAQPPNATNGPASTTESPSKSAPASAPASVAPAKPPANAQLNPRRSAQPAPSVPASATSPVVTSGQSGAEELAIAEKYLNGTSGAGRDSGQASQWLWKAVGKGNLAATVALSDLYLRGDGVPKSCDQGRLLLDAAARKGAKGAGERLRNLQAFDCQ